MASKNNFFNRGLRLLANYQFNNNLIDEARGYNLTSYNVTFNNNKAVFNGINSFAERNDLDSIFSFTDGTNDLPFRIEISVKFNQFLAGNRFIISKRGDVNSLCEWNLFYSNSSNQLRFNLFSNGGIVNYFRLNYLITPSTETIYNIVVEYDGSGALNGLNMKVNGVNATDKTEVGNYTNMIKTGVKFEIGDSAIGANYFSGEIDYLKIYK